MNLHYQRRERYQQILLITVSWTLIGVGVAIYDHILAGTEFLEKSASYSLSDNILANALGGFIAGLTAAPILIFYLKERYRKMSYLRALFLNGLFLTAGIVAIFFIVTIIFRIFYLSVPPWDGQVLAETWRLLWSAAFLRILLVWTFVANITLFLTQVSEKYGQGIFKDILLGRYHRPKQEFRIFMFLDIKSSTTIAEQLGDVQYFSLLREFFNDITDSIINTRGRIYQYVGDEVVVFWSLKDGKEEGNCIRCYFEIEQAIQNLQEKYRNLYGLVPQFKAGFHYGRATVGEIGVIKRDIVFSGDVLNTAARIQGLCNQYQSKLLISNDLREQIQLSKEYQINEIGSILLRGKQENVLIFDVKKNI